MFIAADFSSPSSYNLTSLDDIITAVDITRYNERLQYQMEQRKFTPKYFKHFSFSW